MLRRLSGWGDLAHATLKDIARELSISPSTVSNVFTGRRRVGAAARRRVLEAAERLGYRPNPLAVGLRTGRSPAVGLIIEDLSRPVGAIVQALQHALREAGYALVVLDTEEDPSKEASFLELLASYRVAGLISQSAGADPSLYRRLSDDGVAVALWERSIPGLDADFVAWDHFGSAYQPTAHLIREGHRRVGLLVGNLNLTPRREVLEGWKSALTEHGLDAASSLVRSGPHDFAIGGELIEDLLEGPDPPSAVVITNRKHTIGAVAALNARGVRMPEDLAVIGSATDVIARLVSPPLTYVRVPDVVVGEQLASMLLARLSAPSSRRPPQQAVLSTELILGGTCDRSGSHSSRVGISETAKLSGAVSAGAASHHQAETSKVRA